jgi:hypothetical protein
MQSASATKIEGNVDRAASALFAAAMGYAAFVWFGASAAQPLLTAETAAVAAFAFFVSVRTLGAVQPRAPKVHVPIFDLRKLDPVEPPELLLTERFQPDPAASDEALVLDDILAELGPDSRVVRLFDPAAMPTPGQLNARIERHLNGEGPPSAPPDASQALHDALAELRRSMR